ncbi:MAG: peptide chain release factor N(5)-glutamine methyltransferase [Alphaproteobacteria bacterium]|nr:peptide chain release factor N(5)-glutamine methyltransferase [Alphaproteobacteria bacterium]
MLPPWPEVQRQLVAAGLDPAPREGFFLHAAADNPTRLQELLQRRLAGEPLAYVLGQQPFWRRDWAVNRAVLIPRPDSEVLVQAVLDCLPPDSTVRVAEVGVGSGALLGSVLLERPQLQGVGTDLVPATLAVAAENLQAAGVMGRVRLYQADLLAGVEGPFDLMFSNPPYLSEAEYATLEPGVRDWEPKTALVSGPTGLEAYHALLPQAYAHLVPGGWLAVEIGHTQAAAVASLFTQQGWQQIAVRPDLAGRDRVVMGQK